MKNISAALAAHLAQGQTTAAYLWKVKRTDGVILGFTTHDQDIPYDAGDGDGTITYLARTGWMNTAIQTKSDLSVDNMEVTGFLATEGLLDSEAISASELRAGVYDNSQISIRIVNWSDLTMGDLLVRSGTIGIGKMVSGIFQAEIRGLANYLTTQVGDTYGPICRSTFGSGLNGIDMNSHYKCLVDVAALRQNGTVGSIVDARTIIPDGVSGAADFFDDGIITFTSGALSGFVLEIKGWDGAQLELFLPMPFAPAPGDSFTIEPGCDKTLTKCRDTYNNVVNRHAEDFIPGMDQILNYPNAS